jgi:hypothetical protein
MENQVSEVGTEEIKIAILKAVLVERPIQNVYTCVRISALFTKNIRI